MRPTSDGWFEWTFTQNYLFHLPIRFTADIPLTQTYSRRVGEYLWLLLIQKLFEGFKLKLSNSHEHRCQMENVPSLLAGWRTIQKVCLSSLCLLGISGQDMATSQHPEMMRIIPCRVYYIYIYKYMFIYIYISCSIITFAFFGRNSDGYQSRWLPLFRLVQFQLGCWNANVGFVQSPFWRSSIQSPIFLLVYTRCCDKLVYKPHQLSESVSNIAILQYIMIYNVYLDPPSTHKKCSFTPQFPSLLWDFWRLNGFVWKWCTPKSSGSSWFSPWNIY